MKTLLTAIGATLFLAASVSAAVVKDAKKDGLVRKKAIESLGDMGADGKAAVPSLIDAVKDPDVRLDAVIALGNIGPAAKDAVDALKDAAGDKKAKKDKAFKQA